MERKEVLIIVAIWAISLVVVASVFLWLYANLEKEPEIYPIFYAYDFEQVGEDDYVMKVTRTAKPVIQKVTFMIYNNEDNTTASGTLSPGNNTLFLSAGNFSLIFVDLNLRGIFDRGDTFTFYNATEGCRFGLEYNPTSELIMTHTF